MSESNNNIPMRITQLEEATAYEEGMYYAVAKAGHGTNKMNVSVPTPADINIENSLENGVMYKSLQWVKGYLGGNAGQELETYTGWIDLYSLFTPDKDMTIYTEEGYIFSAVRIINNSNVIQQRINNVTKYELLKNTTYAIELHASDNSNIQNLNPDTLFKCYYYTFVKRAITTCNDYDLQRINGNVPINNKWTNGMADGNAGNTISYLTSGNFGLWYKYLTIESDFPIVGILKDGYMCYFRKLNSNDVIMKRVDRIKTAFSLPPGRYNLSVASTTAGTDISNIDISEIIVLKKVLSTPRPIPYTFNNKIGMTEIATGLTTRRVQGGTVHGNYAWYAQPANPESGNTLVVKIDLTDGTTITSVENESYGHAGGMTYNSNDNTIIIIDYTNSTSYFYELDADTLELLNTYSSADFHAWGIAFDSWSGNYKILISDTMDFNAMTIAEVDSSTFQINISIDPIYINPLPGQDMGFDGEFYYIGTGEYHSSSGGLIFRNGILVFDKMGNYITCHPINSNDEIEWSEVSNGVLYGMLDRSAVLYRFDRTRVWDYQE